MAVNPRAFESRIRDLVPGLEHVYTDVHAHPELSMQETRTARRRADRLVNEIPVVLRADFYALAALAGAAVVVGGHLLHWPPAATTIAGAILCFGVRLIAIRRGWNLPLARLPASS